MRVLGIGGSLRRDSHNAQLLGAAASELPPSARFDIFAGLHEVPPYNADEDLQPAVPAVQPLREAIASADALLIATPEYNASIPGVLKNAIDWASRPFPNSALHDKPVAVVGASTGMFGAVWAQAELRKVLHTAGARVLEEELPVGMAAEAFGGDGRLRDPELQQRLGRIVDSLLREAGMTASLAA